MGRPRKNTEKSEQDVFVATPDAPTETDGSVAKKPVRRAVLSDSFEASDMVLGDQKPEPQAVNPTQVVKDSEDYLEFKRWKEDQLKKLAAPSRQSDVQDLKDRAYTAWKEESRIVRGIFRCREPVGGSVKFSFRKYKWDGVVTYSMVDGKEYSVPLAVARHLNQNCKYEQHSQIVDAEGNPTIDKNRKISRMGFEPLGFDTDALSAQPVKAIA